MPIRVLILLEDATRDYAHNLKAELRIGNIDNRGDEADYLVESFMPDLGRVALAQFTAARPIPLTTFLRLALEALDEDTSADSEEDAVGTLEEPPSEMEAWVEDHSDTLRHLPPLRSDPDAD